MRQEEHHSSDGVLTLVVVRDEGDITVGFRGYGWHTHGDVLAATYQIARGDVLTSDAATDRFVDEVLTNRAVVVVQRIEGNIRDVWVTDDVTREVRHRHPDETLEFRY